MFSIYVPRVLNEHTVQSVSNIMDHFRIGIVQHVDFTPINKKPGFYESFDDKFKSAFIHFVDVPGYQMNMDFWFALRESDDKDRQQQQQQQPQARIQISSFEYWICLKNHSPIQRTMMNIHQVVENGRYLEDRIKTLEDTNKLLQDNNKLLQDNNKLLQDNYKTLEDKLAQLQDRFDNFVNPTCDTWNTDTPMTINELKTQHETHRHWNILDKSLFTKSKDMSDKDFLRYCEYEYNWSYDNRFDR